MRHEKKADPDSDASLSVPSCGTLVGKTGKMAFGAMLKLTVESAVEWKVQLMLRLKPYCSTYLNIYREVGRGLGRRHIRARSLSEKSGV
jgi:hypothetical protein